MTKGDTITKIEFADIPLDYEYTEYNEHGNPENYVMKDGSKKPCLLHKITIINN